MAVSHPVTHFSRRYLREEKLPTVFCPGCGNGIVMNCFLKAVEELGYKDLNNFIFCSGIGCSSWIPSPYFKADSLHTLHGRAIPTAMGLKLSRTDRRVVVFGGDGDLAGIGIGHLVHAARRNIEITVIMVNNFVYGMTGGQVAPTTPLDMITTTTPYGNIEPPLDASNLLVAAGAPYVARWTTFHIIPLKESIKTALQRDHFSFIEVISQCPTQFGRRLNLSAGEMLRWFKEKTVQIKKASARANITAAEEREGKIAVGILFDKPRPGYSKNYYEAVKRLQGEGN